MKKTKKALVMSALSLLACVSMLIGSTFAWFTDSVTSANNIIKSGNLDIELEYWNGTKWLDVKGASDILTNTLFEPGVVEVAYLRIANAGSLALKYQLGVNIVSETPGVNVAGEEFLLSKYIQFSVVEGVNGETHAYANRDAAIAASAEAGYDTISAGYTKAHYMTAGQELYLALIVGMHPTVGNEANHDGVNVPQIDLGINIYATQVDYEEDSFDKYYDGSTPWTGGFNATSWYDANATEYTIGSAEQLAGLAKLVNEGNSFAGKTIKLISNINLNNLPWTPIGTKANGFCGTFDGQNYTISNLVVAETEYAGLFGYALNGGNVKNLTVKNATVSATDRAGAIMGAGYTKLDNCHAVDCNVTVTPALTDGGIYDGGAKAGGIIGQLFEGAKIGVTNCSVNNVQIAGFRDIGGVVGMVHNDNSCSGNTASNVALAYVMCDQITADKNENAGAIYGRVQASATVSPAKDSAENMNFTLKYLVSTGAELKAALANGGEIDVVADIDLGDMDVTVPAGIEATLNMNDYTISGANLGTATHNDMILVKGTLNVKGGKVVMKHVGANMGWNGCTNVFDVTAGGVLNLNGTYVENQGGTDMNFAVHMNNWGEVTLNAEAAYLKATYMPVRVYNSGPDMNNVTINNSTLDGGNHSFWVHNYASADFGGKVYSGAAAAYDEDAVAARLNFDILGNGNTFITGKPAPIRYGFNSSLYFDGNGNEVTVVSSAAALEAAVAAGKTNIYLSDGEYNVANCGGKTLTISGTKNAILKPMNEGEGGADYGFDGSTVTFNGITVDTTANTGSYKGYARCKAIFNDCAFVGGGFTTFQDTTFNNCTFDMAGYIWTWGANAINFDACTFTGDSRTILAHGSASTVITIKDCDFAATTKGHTGAGDWTAAVEIDPTGTNAYTINFVGENTLSENYSGWTRVKDGSTGHVITGLN